MSVIDVSNAAQAMDAMWPYGGLIDVALPDIMMRYGRAVSFADG